MDHVEIGVAGIVCPALLENPPIAYKHLCEGFCVLLVISLKLPLAMCALRC